MKTALGIFFLGFVVLEGSVDIYIQNAIESDLKLFKRDVVHSTKIEYITTTIISQQRPSDSAGGKPQTEAPPQEGFSYFPLLRYEVGDPW